MKYQRPSIIVLDKPFFLNADAQYLLRITAVNCPALEQMYGHDVNVPLQGDGHHATELTCVSNGFPKVGDEEYISCLESGEQQHHIIILSITPGGSLECSQGYGMYPAYIEFSSEPGLPETCTMSHVYISGSDYCYR